MDINQNRGGSIAPQHNQNNQELKVMQIKDKEHYDLMNEFDKQFKVIPKREPEELWAKGFLYQHGETNKAFIAFRHGYGLAKLIYNQ